MRKILQIHRVTVGSATETGVGVGTLIGLIFSMIGILVTLGLYPSNLGMVAAAVLLMLIVSPVCGVTGALIGAGFAISYNAAARVSGGIQMRLQSPLLKSDDGNDFDHSVVPLTRLLEIQTVDLFSAFATSALMIGILWLIGTVLLWLGQETFSLEVDTVWISFSFFVTLGGLGGLGSALIYNRIADWLGGITAQTTQMTRTVYPRRLNVAQRRVRLVIHGVKINLPLAISAAGLPLLWIGLAVLVSFELFADDSAIAAAKSTLWENGGYVLLSLLLALLGSAITGMILAFAYNRIAKGGHGLHIEGRFLPPSHSTADADDALYADEYFAAESTDADPLPQRFRGGHAD